MATIGNNSIGGSTTYVSKNRGYGSLFTAPAAGSVEAIEWYGELPAGGNVKCGIWEASDGGALLGISSGVSVNTTPAWRTFTLGTPYSVVKDVELKVLLQQALTDQIHDRALFMKGIDVSYYYEGYSEFKTEEL